MLHLSLPILPSLQVLTDFFFIDYIAAIASDVTDGYLVVGVGLKPCAMAVYFVSLATAYGGLNVLL